MSLIDIIEVEWKAEGLLTTKSDGDYVRWEVELFRRRYAKEKKAVEETEAAYRQACRGGTFTSEAEANTHTAALRKADTDRSNARAHISELVCTAQNSIRFAKQQDEWISSDRKSAFKENPQGFCEYSVMHATLPGSAEEKRNAALHEAEQTYINDCEEARQDAIESGSRRISTSRIARQLFEERKAAIEEEYYAARY
jgi:hypothetical protein